MSHPIHRQPLVGSLTGLLLATAACIPPPATETAVATAGSPMTTDSARAAAPQYRVSFQARSVVGGYYMKMLADKLTTK